jgi:hypothetical protein
MEVLKLNTTVSGNTEVQPIRGVDVPIQQLGLQEVMEHQSGQGGPLPS